MKVALNIVTEDLPTEFRKYIEQKLLRVLPNERSDQLLLTASIEKHKSKFLMKCNLRGSLSYSLTAKNYNPYLLINNICEKLKVLVEKDLRRQWREDFVSLGTIPTDGGIFIASGLAAKATGRQVNS